MKEIFTNKTAESFLAETANYQGNETLLFYERLQNPEIKEQLINTYLYYYETQDRPLFILGYDQNHNAINIADKWQRTVKTREQIEKEIDEKIKTTFSQTGIDYSKHGVSCMEDEFGFGTIFINSFNPLTNEKPSTKQLSITEAHEKGHFLRDFKEPGKLFQLEILKGFDFSEVEIDSEILQYKKRKDKLDTPIEHIKENQIEYFEIPMEIFERMAQLKNYFGMKGSEKFTKEHLRYAKENYIKDTGIFPSQIKPFLDAITPETEEDFLKLINSLGI